MPLAHDQRELDLQYSPSSRVADIGVYLTEYAARSARARERLDARLGVRYGPRPGQRLDLFPAGGDGTPTLVFVHGGYWQELSRHESSFLALDLVPRGVSVVALGYGLAPAHPLPDIVAMVADGIRWVCAHAPGPVYLAGMSAGAHLVMMALLEAGWHRGGVEPSGAILLSGVYDLEPLRGTYVNRALGLDPATARACSPIHGVRAGLAPLVVARGENETDEFARQQAAFVAAVRAAGGRVTDLVVPSRNHFDLVFDLGDPETALGGHLVRMIST